MSRHAVHLAFCLLALPVLLASVGCNASQSAGAPEREFRPLFDGTTLTGWWGETTTDPRTYLKLSADEFAERRAASLDDINEHWLPQRGILVNDGHGAYLTTEQLFEDFELRLDYRTVAGADSGVYLRGIPQVQIWDTTEEGGKWDIGADRGSGGLWNNSPGAPGKDPLVLADAPFGEWNALRILMVGERVSVWLNDRLVVDHARLENYFDRERPVPRAGPIQLQTHGGEISWRNIRVREIQPEEANAILSAHGNHGFEQLFDGETFDGWQGATDNYDVSDGAITCRAGHGGTLFTERSFADFSVRFEFKLPPGGNNGLAIRYPGSGDPAYSGMCELQVLDNTHPDFALLDARQYHASAYGQAPAHRGYLREPGKWNFQQVTVVGSRITVELNGTRVLDADLAEDTDTMYPIDRFPGRTRTEGHFGFAGHNDPVAFRRIRAKDL